MFSHGNSSATVLVNPAATASGTQFVQTKQLNQSIGEEQ
jgi:hypothetical protein